MLRLIQEAMDRLQPDAAGNGICTADLIIKAVFEDLKVKQNLFKSIKPQLKSEAILATNSIQSFFG